MYLIVGGKVFAGAKGKMLLVSPRRLPSGWLVRVGVYDGEAVMRSEGDVVVDAAWMAGPSKASWSSSPGGTSRVRVGGCLCVQQMCIMQFICVEARVHQADNVLGRPFEHSPAAAFKTSAGLFQLVEMHSLDQHKTVVLTPCLARGSRLVSQRHQC